MSLVITSTTDSAEAVAAAQGDLAPKEVVEPKEKAAAPLEDAEITEESAPPESSDTDDTESDEIEEKSEERPKKKGGFKRRIDKLNAKVSAVEQEREYWRQEALKHAKPEQKDPVAAQSAQAEGKPKAEDFETHEAFEDAKTEWLVEQRLAVREAKLKESQVKSEQEKAVTSFRTKVDTFKATATDFDEVLEDANDIPMSLTVQQAILEADNGPELMYELAKNRDEYKRICALPAIAAARELGKFEARMAKSSESKTLESKTTKAPAPIKPVGAKTTSSSSKSIYDEGLSQKEYERIRERQLAKKA